MTDKQVKWLILIIPTVTIGLWEYVRHTVLLPYISMDLGNLLAPVIVFLVTITLTRRLFAILEDMQESLRQERAYKAALEEREKLAKELHDGISQSLFLLSVKLDRLEAASDTKDEPHLRGIRKMIRHVYEDIRQSIASLRNLPAVNQLPWQQSLHAMVEGFQQDTGLEIELDWQLAEDRLTPKEKVELTACLRESLLNVQKHARATHVRIRCTEQPKGWRCTVEDDGRGFDAASLHAPDHYGVEMMRERAKRMGWNFRLDRMDGFTFVEIVKDG